MNPILFKSEPIEYKVVCLRECPAPSDMQACETPDQAAEYWRLHVARAPQFNPDVECMAVAILNTRRRIRGHQIISTGLLNCVVIHPREVFKGPIVAAASAIILMHNHPSGDPTPSDADIRVTRELIRAGELLRIEVLDHVIMGHGKHLSLRNLGYFYA